MPSGFMYILKCSNDTFYTGSTIDLERRIKEHQSGKGAKYTQKHGPVDLVYSESYHRIDWAFYREHQVKKWSQKKKLALIENRFNDLKEFSKCLNETNALQQFLKNYTNPSPLD